MSSPPPPAACAPLRTPGPRALAALLLAAVAGCAHRPEPDRRVLAAPPTVTASAPAVSAPAPVTQVASPWHERRRAVPDRGVERSPVVRWRTPLRGPVTLPLAVGAEGLWAVAAGQASMLSSTGEELVVAPVQATTAVAPAPDGPVVGVDDGALLALSPTTGKVSLAWAGAAKARGSAVPLGAELVWTTSDGAVRGTVRGALGRLVSLAGDPSSDGQRVYLQTQSQVLAAFDAQGPAWRSHLLGPGQGAPVVGDDLVYAAWDRQQDQPGGVMAVHPHDGSPRWQVELSSPPSAAPALAPGLLLVPLAEGSLQALDPQTGQALWNVRLGPHPIPSPPLIGARSAWAVDLGGRLHRVDLDDGGVAWSLALGAPATAGPELAWGMLIVGLASGEVVAVGEADE
ncbi:PQQ-like beta-propeller repeat protein [Myxococcota bacterium]|nr:PQQ-like beta-propeller repeat protein [Myxococcota bacterium]